MESFMARNGNRFNVNSLRNKLNSEKSKYHGKSFFIYTFLSSLHYYLSLLDKQEIHGQCFKHNIIKDFNFFNGRNFCEI